MACGTPVAAIKGSGGPDEIVENDINGILTSRAEYAQDILKHFKSLGKQQQLSIQARKSVEEKWSLKKTEEALRTSIEQVFVNL